MPEVGEPANVPATPSESPPKPKLISVTLLAGSDTAEEGASCKQWVNLPRDSKWVDGARVTNLDRLGLKLRIKVKFDKAGAHNFKLKLKPAASNAAYTGDEKGRNANFKHQEDEKSYTTGSDGTKIVENDFFLAAAGNDTYQVVGKDDEGTEITSAGVTTHRLVHYVELKMQTLTSVASNLAGMTGEMGTHKIEMVALAAKEMDHIPNISNSATDDANFKTKAKAAYDASDGPGKAPYVIAIAYTDHLAVKDADQVVTKGSVDVGPGKPDVEIPILNSAAAQKYLWHDLVPGEGWFVSASFLKDGGNAATDTQTINEADCTALPLNAANPNLWTKVKVKVTGLTAGTGTITLKVNWVNRMRGGLSMAGNIVCICTRAWWRTSSNAEQVQVMIHEFGHQFGMVADGGGTGPDRVSTQYSGKGHVGNHCYYNLGVLASYASVSGACVMFGATNGITTFCTNCAPALRKQDLSAGWRAFA